MLILQEILGGVPERGRPAGVPSFLVSDHSMTFSCLFCFFYLCMLQVDNHLPDALYPVLISKRDDEDSGICGGGGARRTGKGTVDEPVPFLQLSVIKEVNQATNTAHFDYVAFR